MVAISNGTQTNKQTRNMSKTKHRHEGRRACSVSQMVQRGGEVRSVARGSVVVVVVIVEVVVFVVVLLSPGERSETGIRDSLSRQQSVAS